MVATTALNAVNMPRRGCLSLSTYSSRLTRGDLEGFDVTHQMIRQLPRPNRTFISDVLKKWHGGLPTDTI
jgi:hypothetical protein